MSEAKLRIKVESADEHFDYEVGPSPCTQSQKSYPSDELYLFFEANHPGTDGFEYFAVVHLEEIREFIEDLYKVRQRQEVGANFEHITQSYEDIHDIPHDEYCCICGAVLETNNLIYFPGQFPIFVHEDCVDDFITEIEQTVSDAGFEEKIL